MATRTPLADRVRFRPGTKLPPGIFRVWVIIDHTPDGSGYVSEHDLPVFVEGNTLRVGTFLMGGGLPNREGTSGPAYAAIEAALARGEAAGTFTLSGRLWLADPDPEFAWSRREDGPVSPPSTYYFRFRTIRRVDFIAIDQRREHEPKLIYWPIL